MSLASNLQTAFTRVATEFKAVRTLIGGTGTADISTLNTTTKASLVAAINEINSKPAGSSSLAALTDASIAAPATGHLIRYNAATSKWENVLGTTYYDVAGAAAAAQAASQPVDTDLTAIAALATTAYGRAFLALANQAALFGLLPTSTDGTFAGASDTVLPTQKAVKTYADALIGANDAMVFKGVIDASTNPNYPAGNRGDTYKVSVAGKVGGAAGPNVEVGDLVICITDATVTGTQAAVGANWTIVQVNIDGAVTGPAASTSGDFAMFSGVGGKVLQDTGLALDIDAALTANSDAKIPSQKAVKGYTYSQTQIGDPTTDFSATFVAALA